MADTERDKAYLLATSFPTNGREQITAQNVRDLVASAFGSYGSIYLIDGAFAQVLGLVSAKLTGFAAAGVATGVEPDAGDDEILINLAGVYWVEFSACATGDAATFTVRLAKNGAAEGTLADSDKIAAGDVAQFHFAGPVQLAANDLLSVYGEADAGAKSLTLKHGRLAIKRIG